MARNRKGVGELTAPAASIDALRYLGYRMRFSVSHYCANFGLEAEKPVG
jgi:hypothetical protein